MPRPLVYLIYNLLLPLLLLVGFPAFIIKGIRRGGLARNFGQRLGFFDKETTAALAKDGNLWMHAVSVGEVFVALKIIRALHKTNPAQPIVLSTTTTTGFRVAEENLESPNVTVIHNPVDLPWVAASVLRRINPEKLILVEAEIWPNLVGLAKRRGIPVCLVNARLSPRSEKRYQKFRALIEPIFSLVDLAAVPFEVDRQRWSSIGIREEIIDVVGSVKFDESKDLAPPPEQITELQNWLSENGLDCANSRILLAGSTHDGEEQMAVWVWRNLREEFKNLALVIVPRHQERGAEIATQLDAMGVDLTLLRGGPNRVRSETQQGTVSDGETVYVANTTGELRSWFQLADVVMVGKSFTGKGGQNPVEPVLAGKPVIVGPNMQNFSDVVSDLIRVDGITQVADEKGWQEAAAEFLRDPESGKAQAERGKTAMTNHIGAAERTASLLQP